MQKADIRQQWEGAAPGWARWEATVAAWMEPATEAMLALADVDTGARVLDLACGAGSQTLDVARRVGVRGSVVASDISKTMLDHVRENARAAGLTNVTTLAGAAEGLDVAAESFDAVICRLGLMLFVEPGRALVAAARALRPEGRVAAVVFTTAAMNPFMAQPMQILLRHARKTPPAPGQPGIFALGNPGVLENLLAGSGFVGIEQRTLEVPLRVPSGAEALTNSALTPPEAQHHRRSVHGVAAADAVWRGAAWLGCGGGGEVSRSRAPARSPLRGVWSDG